MANSKHAHLRYNFLDYCFRNRAYSFEQLLDAVNEKIKDYYPNESIATRTLREDLKVFRDQAKGFGAPLPEKARILRYKNANFSIAERPLLEYEQYLIDAAQQLLERFENHPKYDKLAEALIKFQDEEEQEENPTGKVLFYDHNEEYKGIKYLKPSYLAIKNKQVLNITYRKKPDAELYTYEFHPYILKQYNRRWFVYGFNKDQENLEWSIPLDDRLIKFIVNQKVHYQENSKDWNAHFRNLVGIRRNPSDIIHFIKLKFNSTNRLNLFRSKPLVPDFDDSLLDGEENVVHFESIVNLELVQQILSYGKDVEVLEPEILKQEMRNHSNAMQQLYNR